ncbi:unnamed protein product [Leuciscus chuanchicus]
MESESIYLEDDITRETYFPNPNGVFQTDIMRHRGSFAVCGTTKEHTTAAAMTQILLNATLHLLGQEGTHVTISEGQGVQLVGQTVQEYLNSADCYTICDVKGLAIAETSETKDLEFWKSSSRKIFAIKISDLVKLKRQENVSKKKRVEAEESEVLESLQEVELEIKNAAARITEQVDEQCSELNIVVKQVKIMSSLKEALSCRMCTSIPSTTIVVSACCGQVAGCGECVQTYLNGNDACFFCKTAGFSSKLVFLRGLIEFINSGVLAVIPTKWFIGPEEDECYWPPARMNMAKAVIEQQDPHTDWATKQQLVWAPDGRNLGCPCGF